MAYRKLDEKGKPIPTKTRTTRRPAERGEGGEGDDRVSITISTSPSCSPTANKERKKAAEKQHGKGGAVRGIPGNHFPPDPAHGGDAACGAEHVRGHNPGRPGARQPRLGGELHQPDDGDAEVRHVGLGLGLIACRKFAENDMKSTRTAPGDSRLMPPPPEVLGEAFTKFIRSIFSYHKKKGP